MAKGKIDMSKLSLGSAKPLRKKPPTIVKKEAEVDDAAVKKIHEKKKEKPAPPPPVKEPIVRITVDVFKSMHRAIKIRAMDNDVTIRDYIIKLVEKDLKK